jgi:hypothetical protein
MVRTRISFVQTAAGLGNLRNSTFIRAMDSPDEPLHRQRLFRLPIGERHNVRLELNGERARLRDAGGKLLKSSRNVSSKSCKIDGHQPF